MAQIHMRFPCLRGGGNKFKQLEFPGPAPPYKLKKSNLQAESHMSTNRRKIISPPRPPPEACKKRKHGRGAYALPAALSGSLEVVVKGRDGQKSKYHR
jgi:hypothetical protein